MEAVKGQGWEIFLNSLVLLGKTYAFTCSCFWVTAGL